MAHRVVAHAEGLAELEEVELEGFLPAGVVRYLQEVADAVVGGHHVVAGGEGGVESPLHEPLLLPVAQVDGVGGGAVASGTTRLLVVFLQRGGQVHVDHQADVRLVDTHAEGVGGHHDAIVRAGPGLDVALLSLEGEQGVEGEGVDAGLAEGVGYLQGLLAVAHVDDGGLGQTLEHVDGLGEFVLTHGTHQVGDVGPGEGGHELAVAVAEAEHLADVVHHLAGSRGGQGQPGGTGRYGLAQLADIQVRGAEVVAPLADTVRLVHDHEFHLGVQVTDIVLETGGAEAFGSHVQEVALAVGQGPPDAVDLAAGHAGVHEGGAYTPLLEVVNLVLHQGYQGGDDDGDPLQDEAGHLEAYRLAAAGGEQTDGVVAGEHRVDDLGLHGAERVVAPVFLEDFGGRGHCVNDEL